MKRSEWSDKQLEELLRQMPKIQDHRNPQDIYQNLSFKMRKRATWLLPSIATATALLIIFMLVPKLMNGTQFTSDSSSKKTKSADIMMDSTSKSKKDSMAALNKQAPSSNEKMNSGNSKQTLQQADNLKTAVYQDDVGDGTVLTYWIPDPQAQILIPVSTIANDTKDKTWLTLFNEKMSSLTEEDWGLSDFYPINATLKLDNTDNSMMIDVPTNHLYGQGSTNETSFLTVMEKNVATNSNIQKVKLSTNGLPGINFGNFGEQQELSIKKDRNHAYFFYYSNSSVVPFLVPSLMTYRNITEALKAMRSDDPETNLKASMASLQFNNAMIKDNTLFLSINTNSKLINDSNNLHSFEAVLLTAKEFGVEKVVVENAPLQSLGPFDLTKEINVPLAPNLRLIQ